MPWVLPDAKLYTGGTDKTFPCISYPEVRIPIAQVNDDYCDCPDGSDEPGTAACAHLPHAVLSIPGFYCRNAGHAPARLPVGRVNDGVCDWEVCCDGSDEYAGVGGIKCENKCAEIGREAAKLKAERDRLKSDGLRKKKELLDKAKTLRIELEDNVKVTRTRIEAQEEKVKLLEIQLSEVEQRERLKMLKKPKEGSKVGTLVSLAKERMTELKGSLEKVRRERNILRERLERAEEILRTLKEGYNPNFNDEGVKTAVRAWEEYLAQRDDLDQNRAEERDLDSLLQEDEIDWDGFLEGADDITELYNFEAYLPRNMRTWIHSKLASLRQMLVDNGLLAPRYDSDMPESRALTSARSALLDGQNELSSTKSHLESLTADLNRPYGDHDVFRPLKGECVSAEFGEYSYEYCFLGQSHQRSLKDSSSVSLGEFTRIDYDRSVNDPSVKGIFESGWEEAHDEGLSGVSLLHENGQQCWNGPKRSVRADLYCSAVNELRGVREEEKCVYRFEVGTAVVCGEGGNFQENIRDEL